MYVSPFWFSAVREAYGEDLPQNDIDKDFLLKALLKILKTELLEKKFCLQNLFSNLSAKVLLRKWLNMHIFHPLNFFISKIMLPGYFYMLSLNMSPSHVVWPSPWCVFWYNCPATYLPSWTIVTVQVLFQKKSAKYFLTSIARLFLASFLNRSSACKI